MKILLDECVPKPLKRLVSGHEVKTVREIGWNGLKNGALLKHITDAQFDTLLTVDQNISYQQNLADLSISIVIMVASSNRLESLEPLVPRVLETLETIKKGMLVVIEDY